MRACRRILLVENDAGDARLVREMLKERSPDTYHVTWVTSLREAEEELLRQPFEAVLLDLDHPESSGLETLRRLRVEDLPVATVVLTALEDEEIAFEAASLGAQDFLAKDRLDAELLARTIRYACERKQSERRLRESERRYRHIFENVGVSLWEEDLTELMAALARLWAAGVTDIRAYLQSHPDFVAAAARMVRVLDVNRATLSIYGAARKEELLTSLDRILDDDSLESFREIVVALAEGQQSHSLEAVNRSLHGERRDVLLSFNLMPGDGTSRALVSITDVTARKRMEASLAQSDRLAALGMLAAGVAHEINNPLAYVLHNVEGLRECLAGLTRIAETCRAALGERPGAERAAELAGLSVGERELTEDCEGRIADALTGLHRISEIVRDLGMFSRVERDQLVPVDLNCAIEAAVNMAHNEIKYRARLIKDLGRIPPVLGSDGRISQVFLNLLINAAHAIDEGSVPQNEIRLCTRSEGDEVVAEVADTGRGIEKEHLGRIFEPFFTTKARGVGSGLGLAICRSIVEGYGGRISVASQPGGGARFTVRLPVARLPEQPEPAAPLADSGPPLRGRILIVDDEPAFCRSVGTILGEEHDVVTACSGIEARALLEKDTGFDLILCDVMMPEITGIDLHQQLLRSEPELARRMVFVTAGVFTPRAREYLSRTDNLRVEKPFDTASFRRLVREQLLSWRARSPHPGASQRQSAPEAH